MAIILVIGLLHRKWILLFFTWAITRRALSSRSINLWVDFSA